MTTGETMNEMLIEKLKPIICLSKREEENPSRCLIEVLVNDESAEGYVIFWYHWPYDDYMGREDYEPIIFKLGPAREIRAGASRPGWRYDVTLIDELSLSSDGRITVAFFTAWHHPAIKTIADAETFDAQVKARGLITKPYGVRSVAITAIPEYYRNGPFFAIPIMQFISRLLREHCP